MQRGCALLLLNCPLLAPLSPSRLAVSRDIWRNAYFSAHQLCELGINWRYVGLVCNKISPSLWCPFNRWGRGAVWNIFHLSTGGLSCSCSLSLDVVPFENSLKSVIRNMAEVVPGVAHQTQWNSRTRAWGPAPAALCYPSIQSCSFPTGEGCSRAGLLVQGTREQKENVPSQHPRTYFMELLMQGWAEQRDSHDKYPSY